MNDFLRLLWRAWKYRLGKDRAEIKKMLSLIKKGANVADIGAHKGAYTWWLSRAVGLTGHVDAFEPQPQLAARLTAVLDVANVCNTDVHNIALSSNVGNALLSIPSQKGGTPSASLQIFDESQPQEGLVVPTTTLDDFYKDRSSRPLSFIKCDAEGHELEIFQGGTNLLENDRPYLLFECEVRHHSKEKMKAVFDFLHAQKYEGYFFLSGELLLLSQFDPDLHQSDDTKHSANNFLFIPKV